LFHSRERATTICSARRWCPTFRDEATIDVQAGHGGAGLVSFYREKFVPLGGPDGGDGGRGGSVVLVVSDHVNSLLELGRRPKYAARDGQPGEYRKRAGRDAEDLELEVPIGTQVFDAERGNLLRDLTNMGERLVVAQGGAGGLGNVHFTNAVRQAPRMSTPGQAGEARRLRLELKLFAEVGVIGLPNAGKSTFLAKVTAATPKIADYPFTTLSPNIGIARLHEHDTLVIADLPGLIEGASEGHGLGHRFLKHVERCKVLLQLVDVSDAATVEPERAWEIVDSELAKSSPELHAKPRIVIASKCEDDAGRERSDRLAGALEERADALERPARLLRMSVAADIGLGEVLEAAWKLAHAT
jgi:GTP-binding protein